MTAMDSIADVTIAQAATMPQFEDGFINLQEVLRQLAEHLLEVDDPSSKRGMLAA
jgi:hypothetical protein